MMSFPRKCEAGSLRCTSALGEPKQALDKVCEGWGKKTDWTSRREREGWRAGREIWRKHSNRG